MIMPSSHLFLPIICPIVHVFPIFFFFSFFSVGKTSLLNMFVQNRFANSYKATIGADYYSKNIKLDHNSPIQCQFWGELAIREKGWLKWCLFTLRVPPGG